MIEANNGAVVVDSQVMSLGQAYELAAGRISKVTDEELVALNIDIPTAVTVVAGSMPEIRRLREKFERHVPESLDDIDNLETYAYALLHVHSQWSVMLTPSDSLPELVSEASKLRELFVTTISALAQHRLLDGGVLRTLKGTVGHKNIAMDLAGLSAVLRQSWPKIERKCALELADLDRADRLVKQVFEAIGIREQAPVQLSELTQQRLRAFALFMHTYDEVRKVVTMLRWREDDGEQIAPSLYAGRGKRRRSDVEVQQPSAPASPIAVAPPAPAVTKSAAPEGHPDSDPFGE